MRLPEGRQEVVGCRRTTLSLKHPATRNVMKHETVTSGVCNKRNGEPFVSTAAKAKCGCVGILTLITGEHV